MKMRKIFFLFLLLPLLAAAQGTYRPEWQQADPDGEYYLTNRRALVGRGCLVNKLVNEVGIGTWIDDLNNLTDEDISNYVNFPKVVGVGLTVNPIVSVRDQNNYYAAGMEAGFCLVASSGSSVLSLDVIKLMSIQFYCDGEAVGDPIDVEQGQDGAGVGLSLISIPGSEDASINLTATAPARFDEIVLMDAGGLNVAVGDVVQIKYAFVGKANEMKFITSETEAVFGEGSLSAEGWNPVLLGLPFPLLPENIDDLIDDDTENNYAPLTPIIAIGYQGGVRLGINPDHLPDDGSEAFPAGTEVGFSWLNGAALDLDVGAWIEIVLFGRKGTGEGDILQRITVSGDVVGLGVASGGRGMSSAVAGVDFTYAELRFHTVLSVSVGAMGVYYGFVREAPEVPHHCDINPTLSTNLCEAQTTYQLESNPELTVRWSLLSAPEGSAVQVTAGGYVTNLDSVGDYVFLATASDGCREEVTLTHGGFGSTDECGEPIYNAFDKTDYELSTEVYGSSGSLISISDLSYPERILDPDFDNYATYTSGLSVADNLRIIGVKSTEGLIYDGSQPGAEATRVGFVVEFESTGLDVSLLSFFQIRLYHGGKEVVSKVVDETDVLSVGLAGSNRTQKVRFSIEAGPMDDDGNPLQFDEVMLWKSGVLNLTISTLRIYYPFTEIASEQCSDPLRCGVLLSPSETGSSLNGNATQMASALQVAGVTDNISFLLDNDINTAMKVVNTVTAGGGTIIAVKTGRTLDFRHQLVLVTDNKTYTLGAKVGNWLKIETYYRGTATGDVCQDWNVLGLNVIGYGDKNYLLMQPKKTYDEVRITIAGIVGALDFQSYYGIMLRGDIDNDGIPDCQDPVSCFTNIEDIEIGQICQGDIITISGRGTAGTDYLLTLPDQNITDSILTEQDGSFTRSYQLDVVGRYNMLFYDGSGNLVTTAPYTVHPTRTMWKKDPVNTDWNEWTNWTEGSPYCCTDVIIPSDAERYPLLDGEVTKGDEYSCNDIHFEPGAAVNRVPKLNYRKAWVEAQWLPNRYHLLSAPLKSMYTGDMFIPADMQGVHTADYFADITPGNAPQNRFNPTVYQRLWESTAPGRLMDGSETTLPIEETRWSTTFNHLKYAYPQAEGFSLWVDNGDLPDTTAFRFRFPKMHTEYNYYNDFDGSMLDIQETGIDRTDANRFIYEAEDGGNVVFEYQPRREGAESEQRTVYTGRLPLDITVQATGTGTDFLVGNPFMSYIDLAAFFEGNTHVAGVKVDDGAGGYASISRDGLAAAPVAGTVAPMQSFFVTLDAPAASATVQLTETMLGGGGLLALRERGLRLTLRGGGAQASALIAPDGATAVTTLLDQEVRPAMALFAVADGQAFDILSADGRDHIPLGIYAATPGEATFVFTGDDGLADAYLLRDNSTGMTYDLADTLRFDGVGTSANRFELVSRASLDEAGGQPTGEPVVYLTARDGMIRVLSHRTDITTVAVYDAAGRLLRQMDCGQAAEAEVPADRQGALVVAVRLTDGSEHAYRVMLP